MKRKQLLLLLALLLTAATGAWAQSAKHLITATYDKQTRSLEQPLPYETTVGALYEAVTGEPFSVLISTMSLVEKTLTEISSTNTDVVSVGEFNGASTPVTVNADGKAAVALRFGSYAKGIFVSVTPPLYVTMKDGVKDAAKWTAKVGEGQAQALPIGGLKGDGSETVTLQYNGRLKVKSVTATSDAGAPAANIVDLSTLTADYEAKNGDVLSGETAYAVTIADGATVTLNGITLTNQLICAGDATIVLADDSENKVTTVSTANKAGIKIGEGENTTLTINAETDGTGILTVTAGAYGAGIGTDRNSKGGNIVINGGVINTTGGTQSPGIGSAQANSADSKCGNITINDGKITATGGSNAAGIGTGGAYQHVNTCGTITISGGTVIASGGYQGAGIGTGQTDRSGGTINCGAITLDGGTITATAGNYGAGIGQGAGNATQGNQLKSILNSDPITITTSVTKVTIKRGTSVVSR